MKNFTIKIILMLFMVTPLSFEVNSENNYFSEDDSFARIQLIHNAADMAADNVDVFVNGELFLPDFAFRTATPFVDVPADVELTIDIAPAGAGIENSVFDITVEFDADETYVIVANGIVSETGYDPIEPFSVYPFAPAREEAENENETDLLVFHGSTDAPEVSVWAMGGESALFSFEYGEFAGYLGLPTNDYVLEVRTADGETTVVAYTVPLATWELEGTALTVVASGFLNPANNSDGPAFGLFVATPAGGELIALPVYEPEPETARAQIIHNAADLAAANVDVFVNGEIFVPDFAFRTATPFVDVPAGVELTIDVAPAGAGIENSVFNTNVTLEADETYVIVANGIVSETGYDPVEPFTIYPFAPAREVGENENETDLLVFHGSTDAPEVSVWAMDGESALFTFDYGQFAGYLGLPTNDYVLEIRTADGETTVVAYTAPLATWELEGAALTVVASGFLNPVNNSDGPAFGLYVATAAGGELIPLPVYEEDEEEITCAFSQGYWFANPHTVWPYDVEVGGLTFTQEDGQAFWPPNTPTRRAFTQYSAIYLSGVTVSLFPELEDAMETIDNYFADVYPSPAGMNINQAAGFIGDWIDQNHCEDQEPEPEFARAQIIHNAADMAAETVDVFVNGEIFLPDFAFRTATPFVDVPAGVELTIDIAPAGAGIENSVFDITVEFETDETYIIVANGIVSDTGYDPVEPFTVYPFAPAREVGENADETDLLVFHGSTDAPEVSVWAMGGESALFSFEYGQFAGYLGLPTDDYVLEIRTADGETIVVAYVAPLATLELEGAALTVVASGFLNPANNSDGPAFGLYVATAAGGDLIPLPVYEEEPGPELARLQIIHNAADMAAESVDVFVNGDLFLENFLFRTATPFVDVPAGVELTIDIAPAGAGIENSVFDITVEFETDETYIIVANGIVSEEGYDPVQPFTVYPFAPAREVAENGDETDLLVFHGSTDAPEVSVWAMGGESALFTFEYGDFAGYLGLPTDDYVIEIRTADGETIVVAYVAPLATLELEGAALTVVASGFLNPGNNSDGPAFGLFVATAAGGDLIPLPVYEEDDEYEIVSCAYSQGYWFANKHTVWPYDVEVGGMTFTQNEGKAFWPPNTPTRRAFTQYSAIYLSGVTVSEFPELEQAMETIDDYFANDYPNAAGQVVNRAAGRIGNWIDSNHCQNNESNLTSKFITNPVKVFPNPFSDQFSVEFSLDETAYVVMEMYNLSGERVAILFDKHVNANETHTARMNTTNLPDGIYFYRMTANGNIFMDKLILVR